MGTETIWLLTTVVAVLATIVIISWFVFKFYDFLLYWNNIAYTMQAIILMLIKRKGPKKLTLDMYDRILRKFLYDNPYAHDDIKEITDEVIRLAKDKIEKGRNK